jgi:ribonuclease-3
MQNNRSLLGSLAAGLLEAVVAVIYLDGGFDAAREFILRAFSPMIEGMDRNGTHENYKSVLQQYAQRKFGTTPGYVLLDEKGPDHDKCFETQVLIGDLSFTSAWGTNKKDAEQKAALNALVELGVMDETVSGEADSTSALPTQVSDEEPGDDPQNESGNNDKDND